MLEAKAKDTSASALQKEKGLHKNFSGDLNKKKKILEAKDVLEDSTSVKTVETQSEALVKILFKLSLIIFQ